MVNEALLELNHHSKGPVHINIPIRQYNKSFGVRRLPEVKKIDRVEIEDSYLIWEQKLKKLKEAERVLLVIGQNSFVSDSTRSIIKEFAEKYNVAIVGEYMANVRTDYFVNTSLCMNPQLLSNSAFEKFLPEIVLSFGGNVYSGIKNKLNAFAGRFEHWSIQPDGRIVDTFRSIKNVFECSPEYFFKKAVDYAGSIKNNYNYLTVIRSYNDSMRFPEFEYSHMWVIQEFIKRIPNHSNLHLSVNDAIRIANYFKMPKDISVYANIGAVGIDGPLSTFIGQSVADEAPSYLIIGDLAFFYDMNALRINSIKKNVHILMINNQGGSEFYYNRSWIDQDSDRHTSARHHIKAEGWVKENGFTYYSAKDKTSFLNSIDDFCKNSDSPVFFEVFTEMKHDAEVIHKLFDINRSTDSRTKAIQKGKAIIKSTLGEENTNKIAKALRIKK
jgi:2-succinyl-5-enolpyruvyl-6-hydroxy-3-cyclohexene-1-carboxylate synthase